MSNSYLQIRLYLKHFELIFTENQIIYINISIEYIKHKIYTNKEPTLT